MQQNTQGKWEKRWHPLREEWVIYAAHRNNRPWHGAGPIKAKHVPEFDSNCYLCPGNTRVSDHINPQYTDVYIFENDHPVVGLNAPDIGQEFVSDRLYKKEKALGIAKVLCYDSRHNITLSELAPEKLFHVFISFQKEMIYLQAQESIRSVLIFENKGEAVGVSNPHPHCQIYATDFNFKYLEDQLRISNAHKKNYHSNIYQDIIDREKKDEIRIIAENENAIAFIPFFARYAYEVLVFPKRQHQTLITLSLQELNDLSRVFQEVIRKMDMNFNLNFPYVMSVMQAPLDEGDYNNFRMHLWLQPPYRQPGLIKYLAGPEIGAGNFMADTIPEEKAAELRNINLHDYILER